MITKLEIPDLKALEGTVPYYKQIPFFKRKESITIEFSEGVNILSGPNGCGKSTLLNLFKRLTLCEYTTMSTLCQSAIAHYHKPITFHPDEDRKLDPNKFVMPNDGSPCFSMSSYDSKGDYEDNFMASVLTSYTKSRTSTGQYACTKLSSLVTCLEEWEKDMNADYFAESYKKWEHTNDLWLTASHAAMSTLKSGILPKGATRRPTIFLDEPEKGMDLLNTISAWKLLARLANAGYQLIIATHSPLPLLHTGLDLPGLKYIDMKKGYTASIWKSFKQLS